MPHKADATFFDRKHQWSNYKDLILSYYLRPYLEKVKTLNKPILIVDFFAGPGKFRDGSVGSPLIILDAARSVADKGVPIKVICAEQDEALADELRRNVVPYGDLAEVVNADCLQLIEEVAVRSRKSTTLLYLDPFSIGRLHLGRLAEVFQSIHLGASVELLFVFMADQLLRWASACLAAEEGAADVLGDDPAMAAALWDRDTLRLARYATTSGTELDAIAGGPYWREFAGSGSVPYPDRLENFVASYEQRLRQWFPTTCRFPIYSSDNAKVPKYWMLFGTRYRKAIDLVNRAMAKARREQLSGWQKGTLFADVEPPPEVSRSELRSRIEAIVRKEGTVHWDELRWTVTEMIPGMFTDSQINAAIKDMLREGRLVGPTAEKVDQKAGIHLP